MLEDADENGLREDYAVKKEKLHEGCDAVNNEIHESKAKNTDSYSSNFSGSDQVCNQYAHAQILTNSHRCMNDPNFETSMKNRKKKQGSGQRNAKRNEE